MAIIPSDLSGVGSVSNGRGSEISVPAAAANFFAELRDIMQSFAQASLDPDHAELKIDGFVFKGQQIFSPAANLVLQDKIERNQQALSSLLRILDTEIKFEREASQFGH